jgi:hypothetical protein
MEWIYQNPLTKNERIALKTLTHQMGNKSVLVALVKVLSLVRFLKNSKFSSAKKIRESVFFDKKKKHPVFDVPSSESIFKALKHSGGGEYPLTNHLVYKLGSYIKSVDPTPISWGFENGVEILKWPLSTMESTPIGPLVEIGTGAIHGITEAGVSGVNGLGEAIGGPIGLAVVAPFTVVAAAAAACLALAEGDFGQAMVHAINFIPAVGPAMVKLVGKAEHMAEVADSKRDKIEELPFGPEIVEYIPKLQDDSEPEFQGGKRFSTRKRSKSKWRTQRKRYARR